MFTIIAIVVATLVAVVLIYTATKPDTFRCERSAIIQAPTETLFALINDFHQWPAWSPYEKLDPALRRSYSGATSGKGSVYSWEGNSKAGSGSIAITDTIPPGKIVMKLDMLKPFGGHNVVEFTLTASGNGTNVMVLGDIYRSHQLMRSHQMFYRKFVIAAALASVVTPAFAAAEKYKIDPGHTYPSLEFPHMAISVWRGKFDKTSGNITLDRAAKTGSVDVVIDTTSINFGLAAMDEKARSDDFFNVAKFPKATYKGTIKFTGDKPTTVDGQITLMGVTRPVQLKLNLFNCIQHPMLKKEVCGADAEGELNWAEFGMKMSDYGKGDAGKVHLRIQVEALKEE